MRRQLAAIVFGVIVAVAVIYAVFDQRVSAQSLGQCAKHSTVELT